ncbi:hypothetical protein Amal_00508 [Acetobacter malorum]|uniref:Uncharacterized protein n=1 Tax=Acetobacter malorum TaxID=178901 RepID=A0A177GGB5_9PROT|nr:hypothetical protein Amal_00508 [Acetobacter malorum]
MSVDQVKKCIDRPEIVPETPDAQYNNNIFTGDKTLLIERNYIIEDRSFDVKYIFDEKYRLKALNIVGYEGYYEIILNSLSGKYGKPAILEGGMLPIAIWNLPTKHTTIKLQRISDTVIRYEKETDKL